MAKELTSQQQEAIEQILLGFAEYSNNLIEALKEIVLYLQEFSDG